MTTVRVRATAAADGEDDADDTVAILQTDPAWSWLKDPAEDVYTERDAR